MVMDIADFPEPHGSGQGQGSGVGSKRSSKQPANPSSLQLLKYPESELRSQTRLPKLFLDGNVLRPGEALSEFFLQIHQDQRGMVKINQIEACHLIPIQRHQTQLPSRKCIGQSTPQPLRNIFNLCDHFQVLSGQNLEAKIVMVGVYRWLGCFKIDSIDPVDLLKINRSKQIGQGLLSGSMPSVVLEIALNLVS